MGTSTVLPGHIMIAAISALFLSALAASAAAAAPKALEHSASDRRILQVVRELEDLMTGQKPNKGSCAK